MDKRTLYDTITRRKLKKKDFDPYDGSNGRVNRCVEFFVEGRLRTGGTLVDVGAGIGDLGWSVLKRRLFDTVIAVDISKQNLEAAENKGNKTLCLDIDSEGLKGITDESVDSVVALDLIEHIIDPEFFARECNRILKKEGQVFINTPNIQFWKHLESLVCHGVFPHTSGDREVYHGGHLAFFTRFDLEEIFGHAGFHYFEILPDNNYINPPQQWIRFRAPTSNESFVKVCQDLGNPNLLFKCVKR